MNHRSHVRALSVVMLAAGAIVLTACSSGLTGEDLVSKRCTGCHALSTITYSANATEAEWEATVTRMENKGADLTEEEHALIVEYLTAQAAGE